MDAITNRRFPGSVPQGAKSDPQHARQPHRWGRYTHERAQQIEMWHGQMDANAATPPHSHDTEEVVLFLKGSGRATVADREVSYQPGDTLILPPGQVHQIFAETESEFVAAMLIGVR